MKMTLSKPPALNHLYGTNQNGQKYLTEEGREYKKVTAWLLINEKLKTGKLKDEVRLWINLYTSKH